MQTFLPYDDYRMSMVVLDYRRLGKQRVEAQQILSTLLFKHSPQGWRNHPAVRMWAGYEDSLKEYLAECIAAWRVRGYQCSMTIPEVPAKPPKPPWFGDFDFHASHRSNLLRKDPEWYGQWGWTDPDNLEYVWPSND